MEPWGHLAMSAAHEAAHAVVAHHFGAEIVCLVLDEEKNDAGLYALSGQCHHILTSLTSRQRLAVLVAGYVMQSRLDRSLPFTVNGLKADWRAAFDWKDIEEVLNGIRPALPAKRRKWEVGRAMGEALKILEARANAAVAIANHLQDAMPEARKIADGKPFRLRLEGDDLRALLQTP